MCTPYPAVIQQTPLLQSGFYDNNKGLDYHAAVTGGTGVEPKLRVVHVAAEMAPIAKVSLFKAARVWVRGLGREVAGLEHMRYSLTH